MSYDLAIWEGERPSNNEDAGYTFNALYQRYLENARDARPPSPRIKAYMKALLERYPDDVDDTIWSVTPVDDASGPIAYLTMGYSRADEVSQYAGELATRHRLVCFDLQSETLLSS